jgi:hypothetical protein
MSDRQHAAEGFSLLTGWTLASSLGWAAGLTSGIWLTHLVTNLPWLNEDHFFVYATLISLGFTLGIAQAVVLRRCLPHPIYWLTATLMGHLLGLFIIMAGNLMRLAGAGAWNGVLWLVLLGTAIGSCQWGVLRPYYRQAGLWVVATALGFLGWLWLVLNPAHSLAEFVIRGTLSGTLAALVSGAGLVWLVRHALPMISPRQE